VTAAGMGTSATYLLPLASTGLLCVGWVGGWVGGWVDGGCVVVVRDWIGLDEITVDGNKMELNWMGMGMGLDGMKITWTRSIHPSIHPSIGGDGRKEEGEGKHAHAPEVGHHGPPREHHAKIAARARHGVGMGMRGCCSFGVWVCQSQILVGFQSSASRLRTTDDDDDVGYILQEDYS
jgi:hypothetical protein